MDKVKIGILGLQEAKNLKSSLDKRSVELFLNHDESTCRRGCAVTVEILAYEKDLPIVQEVLHKQFSKSLSGLNFDPKVVTSVFDNSKDSAICPACGHEFSTSNTECPDCGLVLG